MSIDVNDYIGSRWYYDMPWVFNGLGLATLLLLGFIFFMVRFGRLSKKRPETRKQVIISMLLALACLAGLLIAIAAAIYGFQGIPSSKAMS